MLVAINGDNGKDIWLNLSEIQAIKYSQTLDKYGIKFINARSTVDLTINEYEKLKPLLKSYAMQTANRVGRA